MTWSPGAEPALNPRARNHCTSDLPLIYSTVRGQWISRVCVAGSASKVENKLSPGWMCVWENSAPPPPKLICNLCSWSCGGFTASSISQSAVPRKSNIPNFHRAARPLLPPRFLFVLLPRGDVFWRKKGAGSELELKEEKRENAALLHGQAEKIQQKGKTQLASKDNIYPQGLRRDF